MAVNEVTVAKLALGALGSDTTIESLSEVSRGAELCNLYYEVARDLVFSAAPWSPLTGYSRLATQSVRDDSVDWLATDPPPGWSRSFLWPNDMLRPRHLSNHARFLPSLVGDTPVIATNDPTPIMIYTRRIANVNLWGVDLMTAVVYTLASMIAKGLTGKDSDLQNMFQLAEQRVLQARANYANSINTHFESMPDWITARGGGISPPEQRYIYPWANFQLSGTSNFG